MQVVYTYIDKVETGSSRFSNGISVCHSDLITRENYSVSDLLSLNGIEGITDRGFTGHEHLDRFQLINMNGRLYDPINHRFLSPDNYVQAPDFTQSLNRYSYCLNNPLKYTDPSGELYVWDDVIVGGVGFAFGYVSYGLTHNDWGWNAVGAGAIGAATFLMGYYSGGATSASSIANGFAASSATNAAGCANTVALGFAGRMAATQAINSFMPSFNMPITDNFSLSVRPGFGMGSAGFYSGLNASLEFDDRTTAFSLGVNDTKGNCVAWGANYSLNDIGGGYYKTYYQDAIGPDGNSNRQVVGGINLQIKDCFSLRFENDFFAFNHEDRWRSNALEIGIGEYLVIGTNLYNNDPKGEGQGTVHLPDRRGNYNTDGYEAWEHGKVYSSPWYFGIRNGNNIVRWGYSHPSAQDLTQNNVHRLFGPGRQNYYVDYSQFTYGPYVYSGIYNPYSLW